ncbi:hypothetical protein BH23CHL7_BH23CHL7_13040 [soil metagenome]
MELDLLLWALGFMLATSLIGGAVYGIYHWLISRPRR